MRRTTSLLLTAALVVVFAAPVGLLTQQMTMYQQLDEALMGSSKEPDGVRRALTGWRRVRGYVCRAC